MLQVVNIKWHAIEVGNMPGEERTVLVAFDDMSVESWPLTVEDILDGEIRAGRSMGLYWADSIPHPDEEWQVAQTRQQKIAADVKKGTRDKIEAGRLLAQITDNITKIGELDVGSDNFHNQLKKYEAMQRDNFRLFNKVLPDLKAIDADLTSSDGSMTPPMVIELVAKGLDWTTA